MLKRSGLQDGARFEEKTLSQPAQEQTRYVTSQRRSRFSVTVRTLFEANSQTSDEIKYMCMSSSSL
ncbi:hypothetical protein EYF80_033043 [Liparis tanakae]|uniref:Uncharacterized protein n=1 Tax=Liparis tanakae TaxID=230148 RepID=A0A4Z2GSQ9_9TELE|nr:hypothetical protein EYF80_033043 [Liparis tanakae]